jgi:hypothetical protein
MRQRPDLPDLLDVDVTTHGRLPGAAEYARQKIGALGRLTHRPVLHARVRLTKCDDPALELPVIAQANLDVEGRVVRAQVAAGTDREAIDRLQARLRQRLEQVAEHWEARRGNASEPGPHEWRHNSEPTDRPSYFPRPEDGREIVRHKSFALTVGTVDDAAQDMDSLDYDFHLFTEKGTGQDSVLYHAGPTGYRLAQVTPTPVAKLALHSLPLTVSPRSAPRLTVEEAVDRLGLLDLPFVFFVDSTSGRGSVIYHRYDGHYGLISPAR